VNLYELRLYSPQDNGNVSSWPDAYIIASNVARDHPAFQVDYQSHFEPFAKWIWARRPPTEALPLLRRGAPSVTRLNCAFCRADRLAKRPKEADVRGKCSRKLMKKTGFIFVSVDFLRLFFIMLIDNFLVFFRLCGGWAVCLLIQGNRILLHHLETIKRLLSVIVVYMMWFSEFGQRMNINMFADCDDMHYKHRVPDAIIRYFDLNKIFMTTTLVAAMIYTLL